FALNYPIHFGSDSTASGLLTKTASNTASPAVILLPAVAGLNPYCTEIANSLSKQGYVSLAIDYYARSGGAPDLSSREQAVAAVARLSDTEVLSDVQAAAHYLQAQPFVNSSKLAVLGFCVGGTYSLLAAAQLNMLKCAVSFYGPPKYLNTTEN